MTYPFGQSFRDELLARCSAFPRIAQGDEPGGEKLKRAAVAIALVEADDGSGQAAFLLTRRAAGLRAHAGQWALPGGRCDPGESLAETALRELEEELGLKVPGANVMGLLDDYRTRSGFAVTPVVVWAEGCGPLRPNPAEVASTHVIRLDVVAREEAVSFETIPESPRPLIRLSIGEHDIHAPTAALVYQLRELAAGRVTRVAELEQPVFAWR